MWALALANPRLLITGATVISIISSDILSKIINLSLTSLEYTLFSMASDNVNASIKKYKEDVELLDIELKLKLVDNWINKIDQEKLKTDKSLELIYCSITDSIKKISGCIDDINQKINYHYTKWFQSWRSIYLDDEIKFLEKNIKILDERIKLLNLIN